MKVKVLDRFVDKGTVIYPGQVINISTEKAIKLIRRRIAEPMDGEVLPYGTTAEYAEMMLEQKAKDGGCGGCEKRG